MNKENENDRRVPKYFELIQPTFDALKKLGGSGTNGEILDQIIEDLKIPDEIANIPHNDSPTVTKLSYRAIWARTYLNKYGVIENSARGVWSIKPDFRDINELDVKLIVETIKKQFSTKQGKKKIENYIPEDENPTNDDSEYPEEAKPWREKLADILQNMDPYVFEVFAQRLLRECGFINVSVTQRSNDGGIDGTGQLQINGMISFNIAFQCKRYKGSVGAPEIRDFRGSIPNGIEKGILITTGSFTKQARTEAADPGKKQIDLIDGEELISKIAEYEIGVKPITTSVTTYEIDEGFFNKKSKF